MTSDQAPAVTDARRTIPMAGEMVRRIQDAQAFLTMAAIELRRISGQAPDVAGQLLHISRQLEAEAESLVAVVPEQPAEA